MATLKTIHVTELIAETNRRNMCSTCSPEMRVGWNVMLEHVLHACNAYAGYNNLNASQVPEGQKPGIILSTEPGKPNEYPDDSRRFYYTHRKL